MNKYELKTGTPIVAISLSQAEAVPKKYERNPDISSM
jgi:hypothetical protein